jgi:hypothetical protein
MARYTLEQINQKIEIWEAADDAVAKGQEYSIGSMRLTRVDAAFIEARLDRLYAIRDQILNDNARIVMRVGRVSR